MRNIKLVIEYDGSRFHGFQKQKNTRLLTVQGLLEKVIEHVTGSKVKTASSGRTDTGVNALNQVVTFKTPSDKSVEEMKKAFNALCLDKIIIKECEDVPPRFHARFTATARTYRYYILNREQKPCIGMAYVHFLKKKLDIALMLEGCSFLVGEKDFIGVSSCIKETTISIRRLYSANVYTGPEFVAKNGFIDIPVCGDWIDDLVIIEFRASGFLRSMARMMCALLIRIGTGRCKPCEVKRILDARDPSLVPAAVPPNALFLCKIDFEDAGIDANVENV